MQAGLGQAANGASPLGKRETTPGAACSFVLSAAQLELAAKFLERQSPEQIQDLPNLLARYAALHIAPEQPEQFHLTPCQKKVARMLRDGIPIGCIAKELKISVKAVKHHLHQIYRAFGIIGEKRTKHVRLVATLLLPLNSPLRSF